MTKSILMMRLMCMLLFIILWLSVSGSFVSPVSRLIISSSSSSSSSSSFCKCTSTHHDSRRSIPLFGSAGGFGSSSSSKSGFGGDKNKTTKKKQKQEDKLKPKQQWDRYLSFQSVPKIRVAVRCKEDAIDNTNDANNNNSNVGEWLEVGNVKAQKTEYIELAVARQRAIIAEHAKRLYPLQVSNKKPLEWGYYNDNEGTWKVVDKSILEKGVVNDDDDDDDDKNDNVVVRVIPEHLEKMIGFEGRPDPSTGFYCVYEEGRRKLGEESSFKLNKASGERKK